MAKARGLDEDERLPAATLAPTVGRMSFLLEALTHASECLGPATEQPRVSSYPGKRNRGKREDAPIMLGKRSRREATENKDSASMSRSTPFPRRLFHMVSVESQAGSKVVLWSEDGRAFFVHNEETFIDEILPKHGFKASKIASFQRNLNIYGFQRMTRGAYVGGYVHHRFHRGMAESELASITRRESKASSSSSSSSSSYVPQDDGDISVAVEHENASQGVAKPPSIVIGDNEHGHEVRSSPLSMPCSPNETTPTEAERRLPIEGLLSLQENKALSNQVSPLGVELL